MQNRPSGSLKSYLDYPNLVAVTPMSGYRLKASFSSGETKVADMTPYLAKKMFRPLNDVDLFNKARAEYGGVIWNDEIDLAQEALYDMGIPAADSD